jgi:hypothetical protein
LHVPFTLNKKKGKKKIPIVDETCQFSKGIPHNTKKKEKKKEKRVNL